MAAGVTGMSAGAALVVLPAPTAVAVAGFILIGLAAAPMFPLLTLTTRERVGAQHTDQAVGVQVAASSIGAVTFPAIIGLLIGQFGTRALGPCLLVLAFATATAYTTRAGRPSLSTR
jgi:fucose permease